MLKDVHNVINHANKNVYNAKRIIVVKNALKKVIMLILYEYDVDFV